MSVSDGARPSGLFRAAANLSRESALNVRDVVFVYSHETWDDAVRRSMVRPPDRFVEILLRDDRVRRLLVANPFRSAVGRLVRRAQGRVPAPFPTGPSRALLQPLHWSARPPRSEAAARRLYRSYGRRLRVAASRLGLDTPIVLSMSPLVAGFSELAWAGDIVYWARDDWAEHPSYHRERPAVIAAYRALSWRGVKTTAVTSTLLERIAPEGPSRVIPNGVLREEWRHPVAAPEWMAQLPRPRILYQGTVDTRLDVATVVEVARRFSRGTVVLLGQQSGSLASDHLRRLPNLVMREAAHRSELLGAVFGSDVGIIPHRINRLTEAMSPLKLYEYLAAGRPVVGSRLRPLEGVGANVVLADLGKPFAEAVSAALAASPVNETARQKFISENSWQRRFDELWEFACS